MVPPCRLALQTKTECPRCRRPVSIKTLKYTHECGRTWDIAERALEEERKAHLLHPTIPTRPHEGRGRYAELLAQIN